MKKNVCLTSSIQHADFIFPKLSFSRLLVLKRCWHRSLEKFFINTRYKLHSWKPTPIFLCSGLGTCISKQAPPGFLICTDWEINTTPLGTDVGLADLSQLIFGGFVSLHELMFILCYSRFHMTKYFLQEQKFHS